MERQAEVVCKMCGTVLTERAVVSRNHYTETVPFCPRCRQIETGTSRWIYEAAKDYVQGSGFQYFPDQEEDARCLERNYAKVCEILNELHLDLHLEAGPAEAQAGKAQSESSEG